MSQATTASSSSESVPPEGTAQNSGLARAIVRTLLFPVSLLGVPLPRELAHVEFIPDSVPSLPLGLLTLATFIFMSINISGLMYSIMRNAPSTGFIRDPQTGQIVPVFFAPNGVSSQYKLEGLLSGAVVMGGGLCLLFGIFLFTLDLPAFPGSTSFRISGLFTKALQSFSETKRYLTAIILFALYGLAVYLANYFLYIKLPFLKEM